MFTVKWVASNGSEAIMTAIADVHYTPPMIIPEGTGGPSETVAQCVSFAGLNDIHTTLHTGTIYVMNENGATVSTYRLD